MHSHVLLARTTTGDLALLVQEVQHATQDGQQEYADNNDHNDDAVAL